MEQNITTIIIDLSEHYYLHGILDSVSKVMTQTFIGFKF